MIRGTNKSAPSKARRILDLPGTPGNRFAEKTVNDSVNV